MSKQMITGTEVEVMVMAADGTATEEPLTPRELWTVQVVDAFLRMNEEFKAAYPEAKLEREDSITG